MRHVFLRNRAPTLFFLAAAGALLLTACATPSTLLINDAGQVYRCAAAGTGLYGMATASSMHSSCVADLQKAGYAVMPDGEMGLRFKPDTLIIVQLVPQKGAALAGLLVGDTVTRINDVAVHRSTDVTRAFQAVPVGATVSVTVVRDGDTLTRMVAVSKRGA